jgi:hypothetical protein
MMRYLDAPEEKAAELKAMIENFAQTGYWPRLVQDLDDEVWRRALDKIDELKARVG